MENFWERHYLSVRRKTNIRKTSVFNRLHKINNFKYYAIYKLADDPISSESEESSSEEDSSDSESDIITSASESES